MKKKHTAILIALALTMSMVGCKAKTEEIVEEPEETARAIEVVTLSNDSITSEYTYSGKVA